MAKGNKIRKENTYINSTVTENDMSGGVRIGGNEQSGSITIGGDVVSGDKITTNNSGMSAADVAALFDSIYKKIDQKPPEDQADIRHAVDVIKTAAKDEAVDGKAPDASSVTMASQSLAMTAPDLLKDVADVAMATLTSPAAGVAAIIRKVIDKAKAAGGGG